jgi:hypothetical protein
MTFKCIRLGILAAVCGDVMVNVAANFRLGQCYNMDDSLLKSLFVVVYLCKCYFVLI